jgi:hypothetical protein
MRLSEILSIRCVHHKMLLTRAVLCFLSLCFFSLSSSELVHVETGVHEMTLSYVQVSSFSFTWQIENMNRPSKLFGQTSRQSL